MEIHVECDTFLIFFQHGDREAEAHNREIHRCAVRGQRYDPSAFAAALIADASQPCTSETLRFFHCRNGIVGENIEILRICAARGPSTPLVIHKRANPLCGKHPLQGISVESGIVLGTVHQDDYRDFSAAFR